MLTATKKNNSTIPAKRFIADLQLSNDRADDSNEAIADPIPEGVCKNISPPSQGRVGGWRDM